MKPVARNEILGLAEYEGIREPFRARIIAEKALLRKMIETMTGLIGRAYDPASDAFDLMDQAEGEIFRISDSGLRRSATSMNVR